jgi:alkylation response protein AidB-like acyl-CoA dehydrogenase
VNVNERPDLGSRVEAVCRELSTDDSADDTDPGEHRVNSILRAFARHGLLDLVCSHRGGAIDRRNIREMATVINLLAANSGLFASVYMVNAILGGALVSLAGTEQQKVELLPALQKGRHQLAFAMTEPEAGSDAAGIKATATQEGDDFLLQGEKLYTTGAASADSIIVVARTAEHSTSRHALTLFLVPRRQFARFMPRGSAERESGARSGSRRNKRCGQCMAGIACPGFYRTANGRFDGRRPCYCSSGKGDWICENTRTVRPPYRQFPKHTTYAGGHAYHGCSHGSLR